MSTKKHIPITLEDLNLTPEEMETFASGARFLFANPNEADDSSEDSGEDKDAKEGKKLSK
jgi:hypothetical protein